MEILITVGNLRLCVGQYYCNFLSLLLFRPTTPLLMKSYTQH